MKRLLMVVALTLTSSSAFAAACPTTITAPCTIETNGDHILGATLDITNVPVGPLGYQVGILIAPGVSLANINCDIFGIHHGGGYDSRGVAVYGENVANVEVKNCNIFGSGMLIGVNVNNEANPAFDTIAVRDSVISARLIGVVVRSRTVAVTGNLLRMLGRQSIWSDSYPGGVAIHGLGVGNVTIADNRVFGIENLFNAEVFGISCTQCFNGVIARNSVENQYIRANSWAFWVNAGIYQISNNSVINFDKGFGLVTDSSGVLSATNFVNVNTFYVVSDPDWIITDPPPPAP